MSQSVPVIDSYMKKLLASGMTDLKTFQARVYQGFALITIVVLIPFTLNHYYQGRLWLGSYCAAIVLLFTMELASQRFRKRQLLPPPVTMIPVFAALIYSVAELGTTGIFWGYPALFLLYFILERRTANIFALLFISSLGILTTMNIGQEEGLRATVTLSSIALFSNIFLIFFGNLHEELQNLSITDPLTGALNRRQLNHSLAECISRRDRYQTKSSLISIDVDDFKYINDRFGHVPGDEVLKNIVKTIRSRTRSLDQVFRTGGDEFLIVLPETGEKDAKVIARELKRLVSANQFLARHYVSISMGVSELNPEDTATNWIERCDNALYQAKDLKRHELKVVVC